MSSVTECVYTKPKTKFRKFWCYMWHNPFC